MHFELKKPTFFTMDSSFSHEQNKHKQIAIIGAGISGLLACKHTKEKGFNPIVFEAKTCIGGVWTSTIASTKLQTPKDYFKFSDFPWPDSVSQTFPDHDQVMSYITSYALHFDLFSHIIFNSKVISIDPFSSLEEKGSPLGSWGGSGDAFSDQIKWRVIVKNILQPLEPPKVYEVDFVILCIGKFSDLPNIPDYSKTKEANMFKGEVIHSMDYAAMDKTHAKRFIRNKRVTVIGFRKSALDIAAEIATENSVKNPCMLLFRRAHWSVSKNLVRFIFRNLNRFSEITVHKPSEGLIRWFLVVLLSPLRWIFSKFVEWYLIWTYPLKKHDMVPDYTFLGQIYSCMTMVLPEHFYDRVREGSLILKKANALGFCENGLVLDNETDPLKTDIVIFATGFKSDEKISNIFASYDFKKRITGSSAPFYRECIHPRIPQLAILGYSESSATLFTFELRSKWIAHFLAGKFKLPSMEEMENDVEKWEKNARRYSHENYKRACVGVMLQIHCNDQLLKDFGSNPRRKKWLISEWFSAYNPADYANI